MITSPERRDFEKLKKGGGSMVQGQVFLKEGRGKSWYFFSLIFSRFIIIAFRNYHTLCIIVLCIEEKNFFSHHEKKFYEKKSFKVL